jgi:indolepyruvate ferredoxin oxidoreductase, beta subunit
MMDSIKILITGVGGQGVVFLTNLLVKASALAGINVCTSEVHGLAQRGGCVKAGITFGDNTHGFIEEGGVDILLGLEPLEAQRCVSFLNPESIIIIDSNRILPTSVNTGLASYPDPKKFIAYLKENVRKVCYLEEELKDVNRVMRNLYVLGVACSHDIFPIDPDYLKKAIKLLAKRDLMDESLKVFESALTMKDHSKQMR